MSKLFIMIIPLFLLATGIVHANVTITNLVVSDEIWINENSIIQISLDCEASANVYAEISGNGYQKTITSFIESPASHYTITASLGGITENNNPYPVDVFCEKNTTTNQTSRFFVNKLYATADVRVPSQNPGGVLYPSDIIDIELSLLKNGNLVTYNTTIDVSMSGQSFEILSINPPQNTLSQRWEIEARIPKSLTAHNEPIIVTAAYNGHQVSFLSNKYSIDSQLKINIIEPSVLYPYNMLDAGDMNITVNVKYRGRQLGPYDILDFRAVLDGSYLTIRKVEYNNPSTWIIVANVPKMNFNRYDLHMYVSYDGYESRTERPLVLQFVIPFQGVLYDADNKPVYAEMRIKGNGIEEKIFTKNGQYYTSLAPGSYDIYMLLRDVRFKFSEVEITYLNDLHTSLNNIKYDFIDEDIEAVDAVKLFALEFFLPFEDVEVVVPYRDSEIDENRIIVYKCSEWNFDERECRSEWEEISSHIDELKNFVSFSVSSLSAFAISTEKYLEMEISTNKNKYYMGELVIINGTIKDNEGNPIGDADVEYMNSNLNVFGTSTTGPTGNFDISFVAPKKETAFVLEVKAEKTVYEKAEGEINLIIYKRTLLSLEGKTISITLGNSSKTNIIVSNNGHTEINNINISITGIPEDWYELKPKRIDHLSPDKNMGIELTISVPEECEECKESYIVDAVAEADETNAINTFSLLIVGISKDETVTKGHKQEAGEDILTGFAVIISKAPTEYMIYTIIIIAIVLFFMLYKRKKTFFGLRKFNKKRTLLSNSLHEIKIETFKHKTKHNQQKPEENNTKKKKRNKAKNLKQIFGSPFE